MANVYKRLGALRPTDTNEAKLYGPTASKQAIANIMICNQDTEDHTYYIALTDADTTAAVEDWIVYDRNISPNMIHDITGLCLSNPDTIRVKASIADKISFVIYGLEIS
jgi:hypothetical protein